MVLTARKCGDVLTLCLLLCPLIIHQSIAFQADPMKKLLVKNIVPGRSDEAIRKRIQTLDHVYEGEKIIEGMTAGQLWEFVADTDALNRNMGSASAKVFYQPVSSGVSHRQIEWNLPGGITLNYEEEPFEWDTTNHWWHVVRKPHEGPIERVEYFIHCHPEGEEDSRLEMVSAIKARDGDVEAAKNAIESLNLFYHTLADESLNMLNDRQPWKLTTSDVVDKHQLEVLTRSLYDLGEDKNVVDQMIHYLIHTQDSNLVDMQPLSLASKWKVEDEAAISCFLRAARIGLLEPEWSLMCPSCRGSKSRTKKAFDLPKDGHCQDCNINIKSNPRTSMQMVFGTSVRGKTLDAGRACVGSPTRTPHILAQANVDAGGSQTLIDTRAFCHHGNCKLALKCPGLEAEIILDGKVSGVWTVDEKDGFVEVTENGEGVQDRIIISNKSAKTVRVYVEDLDSTKYTRPLSAESIMKNPGFKTLFGAEEWDFLNAMTGKFSMEFGQEEVLSESEGLEDFDIAVIGSGPAGESLALASARLGKRVALIEQAKCFGGPTGLGSKAFREAALKVLAWSRLNDCRPTVDMMQTTFNKRFTTFRDYAVTLVSHELMSRLGTAGISLIRGRGEVEKDGVKVTRSDGRILKVQSPYIGLAVGSRPARPDGIPFDGTRVLDAEEMSKISELPKSIVIIGGGIIAIEYASIMGALGVQTHVVNAYPTFLPMLERTLCDSLLEVIENTGVIFHKEVKITEWRVGGTEDSVTLVLSNGDELTVETVLYAQGREGTTDNLVKDSDLELTWSKRGFLNVGDDFGAGHPGVYAIGDVVGGGVASTAMDHGRRLAESLFAPVENAKGHGSSPLVLWTIPEVASVGLSKEKAEDQGIKTISVRAEFRELPRGLLTGDLEGYLDMLVDEATGVILGVHLLGTGSSELVHYGASLVSDKITVGDLAKTVFAAVTLHDLFNVAAERALLELKNQNQKEQDPKHETRGLDHRSSSKPESA